MTLIGMHLFLRGNEIMDLGFFSLMEENTIYDEDGMIAGLLVQILGKNKKTKKNISHVYSIMGYAYSSVVVSC